MILDNEKTEDYLYGNCQYLVFYLAKLTKKPILYLKQQDASYPEHACIDLGNGYILDALGKRTKADVERQFNKKGIIKNLVWVIIPLTKLMSDINENRHVYPHSYSSTAMIKDARKLVQSIKLEESFSLDDANIEQLFNTFKNSYEENTGTSWTEDKFISRAKNWTFYGDDNGYVAVRKQASGMKKLVGVAGDLRSILRGLSELQNEGGAIWGAVSEDIAKMAKKRGMVVPHLVPGGAFIIRNLIKFIPASAFGGFNPEVTKDGGIVIDYPDVGRTKKYLIGNKEYFKQALHMPQIKDVISRIPLGGKIVKKLTEDVHTLAQNTLKRFGYDAETAAYAGRCYEYRDMLYAAMKKAGLIGMIATDSIDWIRTTAMKVGQPVGVAESLALEENNHAWIYYQGKHYDSINTNGVPRVTELKFFKDADWRSYEPEEDDRYDQLLRNNRIYDREKDQYIKVTKTQAQKALKTFSRDYFIELLQKQFPKILFHIVPNDFNAVEISSKIEKRILLTLQRIAKELGVKLLMK